VRIRRAWIVYAVLGLALAVPLGAVLLAWSGVYNVAASRGHLWITDLFLRFGMENSVRAHAPEVQPPALDDPDLIRLGAGHFHSGCAYCHGAPGVAISPISLAMLPAPPNLEHRVAEWTDQELFWIVKHGIKYAGMPAWPAQERDDEVWPLVAFLRQLTGLTPEDYRTLALGNASAAPPAGRDIALGLRSPDAAESCARCHGGEDRPPASALVPRLHGQRPEMLLAALEAFAKGERRSGIMQPIAAGLAPETRQALADYYASLSPPAPQASAGHDPARTESGRDLAMRGHPEAGIPACDSCHGASGLPLYPRLAGQNAPYLANQLRLWQRGGRVGNGPGAIMAPIARKLSEQQIDDVAAFYSSLPAEAASASTPVRKAGAP
jgi:cytochrome c553